MKLDTWKSTFDGRALLSVPSGVSPWSVVEPGDLAFHLREIRLFRRSLDPTNTPLVTDVGAILSQIADRGFALHYGSLMPKPTAEAQSPKPAL